MAQLAIFVTCYCGKKAPPLYSGERHKCSCGIVLHVQQRKNERGCAWGTIPNQLRDSQRIKNILENSKFSVRTLPIQKVNKQMIEDIRQQGLTWRADEFGILFRSKV